jgi:hypothetical protein
MRIMLGFIEFPHECIAFRLVKEEYGGKSL